MGKLKNIHPGEICVPSRRINEIVLGKRSITAGTALRPSKVFAPPSSFGWGCRMNMIYEKTGSDRESVR